MVSGSFKALNNDLKILVKLPSCSLAASGEIVPDVQGSSLSPGRSRRSRGIDMITTTVSESEKMAVKNPY
jgi:hypothetical protein